MLTLSDQIVTFVVSESCMRSPRVVIGLPELGSIPTVPWERSARPWAVIGAGKRGETCNVETTRTRPHSVQVFLTQVSNRHGRSRGLSLPVAAG